MIGQTWDRSSAGGVGMVPLCMGKLKRDILDLQEKRGGQLTIQNSELKKKGGRGREVSRRDAVLDATGARLLQLPMTPERIEEALTNV